MSRTAGTEVSIDARARVEIEIFPDPRASCGSHNMLQLTVVVVED